jgi:hypothetical protein
MDALASALAYCRVPTRAVCQIPFRVWQPLQGAVENASVDPGASGAGTYDTDVSES